MPRLPRAGASPTTRLDAPNLVKSSGIMVPVDIREKPRAYPTESMKNAA